MDKFNRIWQLHKKFSNRCFPIKIADLAALLECSEKTISRTLKQMPLEYIPDSHGWRYTPDFQRQFEPAALREEMKDRIHSVHQIFFK